MENENCCSEGPKMDTPRTGGPLRAGRGELGPPVCDTRSADARIRQVENGFIAEIGYKTFVAQNWEELAAGLAEYWKDPAKAEAKFSKKR